MNLSAVKIDLKTSWPGMLVVLAMAAAFAPTFYRLATIGWRSADFTHAFFVLPISLGIMYFRRKELVPAAGVTADGAGVFLLGLATYVVSGVTAFMFLEAAAFVLVMTGVFLLRYSRASVKKAALFPLAYLVFLIPPPRLAIDMITFPLKQVSALGSLIVLNLLGFETELYGVILRVGEHELFIADACSGFRSIVSLLALGAVFVYFQRIALWKKWAIFASILPISLFANITRIVLTGILAVNFGSEFAEGFFHDFSGAVLFFITVLCLIGIVEKGSGT